jgi:hypothetical protein
MMKAEFVKNLVFFCIGSISVLVEALRCLANEGSAALEYNLSFIDS